MSYGLRITGPEGVEHCATYDCLDDMRVSVDWFVRHGRLIPSPRYITIGPTMPLSDAIAKAEGRASTQGREC